MTLTRTKNNEGRRVVMARALRCCVVIEFGRGRFAASWWRESNR